MQEQINLCRFLQFLQRGSPVVSAGEEEDVLGCRQGAHDHRRERLPGINSEDVPRKGAETVVGPMAGSYVNANHIGIPVAIYAIGNATPVAPVLLVQLLVLSPLFLLLGPGHRSVPVLLAALLLDG